MIFFSFIIIHRKLTMLNMLYFKRKFYDDFSLQPPKSKKIIPEKCIDVYLTHVCA